MVILITLLPAYKEKVVHLQQSGIRSGTCSPPHVQDRLQNGYYGIMEWWNVKANRIIDYPAGKPT